MTQHRKTRKSWNAHGHAHFLTYSCVNRLPLLSTDRVRRWVIEAMTAARRSQNLELWAYVIMPEHVHVLLFPNDPDNEMRRILAALKRPVAKAAHDHLKKMNPRAWIERLTVNYPRRKVFRFWQSGGGYDRNVFRKYKLSQIFDYIHANPVRRELVNTPREWSWSSARFWEGQKDVPLRMDSPEI
ncbi:MAG: transposase [Phycisphaerales bacterium]|nr:transposase [Phycisphaerales bacterium]